MLAAAPTTPPCFRRWRRSSLLQRKNYFNFRDSGATAFVERSVAMKAPVGLLSGRAVCVSRWRGFAPTSSADAPLSHFHGWGRGGKRHLQRLLPAEAAAREATSPSPSAHYVRIHLSQRERPWHSGKVTERIAKPPVSPEALPLGELPSEARLRGRGRLRRTNPLRLTAFASSPEGGAFFIFRLAQMKLPLRGSWHRAERDD